MALVDICTWGIRSKDCGRLLADTEELCQWTQMCSDCLPWLHVQDAPKTWSLHLSREVWSVTEGKVSLLAHITNLSSCIAPMCWVYSLGHCSAVKRSACICVCRFPGALSPWELCGAACGGDGAAEGFTCIAGEVGAGKEGLPSRVENRGSRGHGGNTSLSVPQQEVFDVGSLLYEVECCNAAGLCAWGRGRAHRENSRQCLP